MINRFLHYFAISLALLLPAVGFAVELTAEGRASGDYRTAREQALADAMREAVRLGIGVDLLGESRIKDFAMDYDRVLCSAFGHVKNYSILESKLGKDGIYRVKIQAEVAKGAPENKDSMALQQLIQAKGAPRLAFRVGASTDGDAADGFSQAVLEEVATELQIPVVKSLAETSDGQNTADYFVEAQITANLERIETIGANPTARVFSIACELRALDPETKTLVAVASFGSDRVHKSILPSDDAAQRDAIKKLLTAPAPDGGMRFFEKLLARWVSELDLGSVKRLEFSGITSEDFEKIQTTLTDTDKVGAVWPREFNANGKSVIDVETRLDNMALGKEVSKASVSHLSIVNMAKNRMGFRSANRN
jgi:hypothetical protein